MNAEQTPAALPPRLRVCELGLLAYAEGLSLQQQVSERRQADEVPDTLLLLEHPPTYTRGRRARDGELPFGEAFYRARGIEVHATDRGGRVTYHGPGQLVGYPIMRVSDVGAHLCAIEEAIIAALGERGVGGRCRAAEGPDYTGVWVDERKIASIGVHVCRGVTTHGFAVNVDCDLEPFSWITACGLAGVQMTSLRLELGGAQAPSMPEFGAAVARRFSALHGRLPERVDTPLALLEAVA